MGLPKNATVGREGTMGRSRAQSIRPRADSCRDIIARRASGADQDVAGGEQVAELVT